MVIEQLVSWVGVLAPACGAPQAAMAGLLIGVRGALEREASEGVAVDRVQVARRGRELEVVLFGERGPIDTFVFVA